MNDNLTSNMEDYLETIHSLKKEHGFARVGEIAEKLNVKSSSVNSAVKFLTEQNLVVHEKYGYVGLTKEGDKIAQAIQSKHDILFCFLTEFLLLDPLNAEQEACAIEHAISKQTFLRLAQFIEFLEKDLHGQQPKIIRFFKEYLNSHKHPKGRKKHME